MGSGTEDAAAPFVSTGELPSPRLVQSLVVEAYERYRTRGEGANSEVYPGARRVPERPVRDLRRGNGGKVYSAGDADVEFTIMSVAKPFVFALVCEAARRRGAAPAGRRERAPGCRSTRSAAVEQSADGRTNPMVNPGAIATTSLVPGATARRGGGSSTRGCRASPAVRSRSTTRSTGRRAQTNHRNQSLARLLAELGRLYSDPAEAVDLYTRQSCLAVTARDLAVMGATLADGGVNPLTGERVVDAETCHCTLAVMTTAGLYETSGDWLYDVGLPGKSGIGGGIVTVAPGKGGLGTFAPPLDAAGNSVKGQLAARVPVAAAGPRPLRVGARAVRARRRCSSALAFCARSRCSCRPRAARPRRRDGARRAVRAGRAAGRRHRECGPGEPYEPIDVDLLFDEPTVALRGPWKPATS